MNAGKRLQRFASLILVVAAFFVGEKIVYAKSSPHTDVYTLPRQTNVDEARHLLDPQGVPILDIHGLGPQRHPAGIAVYALAYAGLETYDERLAGIQEDPSKFRACIRWLADNLIEKAQDLWVWEYRFDSTYNDITVQAPWASAFAQAVGIQALLASYKRDGDSEHLELARKAAKGLFMPINRGGFLFQTGKDIWFEEIPVPSKNPGHVLNGHMRVLLALRELADATGDQEIKLWFERGCDTLNRWLPRYDSGYWLRYDLNPKKKELLFRFANPYGFLTHPLAVDRITLRDPTNGKKTSLDIGADGDSEGPQRIAGIHWGPREQVAGRTVRRLVSARSETNSGDNDGLHTYFYLRLPGAWKDNLRCEWYELIVDYYDDGPANVTIQQRSIAPGQLFRDMRDGDLHLTGAQTWRRWIVPVRPSDLGWWVGAPYAEKHARYLEALAQYDSRFSAWSAKAKGYLALSRACCTGGEIRPVKPVVPEQTPTSTRFALSSSGVLQQYIEERSVFHPYMIADQLLTQGKAIPVYSKLEFTRKELKREPALQWFLEKKNQKKNRNSITFNFDFRNVYNDVVTEAPWASAFVQAYVLKALVYADKNLDADKSRIRDLIEKVANSFRVPIAKGGVTSYDSAGLPFFEEVPNTTHVLNAHLVSINELYAAGSHLRSKRITQLAKLGAESLKEHLHRFDTGYWLRYDLNPKKELLFQLDWLEGTDSPQIDEILFENPQTGRFIRLDVGAEGDFEGPARISGAEWLARKNLDGRTVRGFTNGYAVHEAPVVGGTRQNVYFFMTLPDQNFQDFFDVPAHRLVIRYKDTGKSRLVARVRTIHEGKDLHFVPLRGGVWQTQGDGKWKETQFVVRPQDLGWYKGPDYQRYEAAELQRLAEWTGETFFRQYAKRHFDFLRTAQDGNIVIMEGEDRWSRLPAPRIIESSATYPAHGFENALDENAVDNYVAGIEGQAQAFVVLDFGKPVRLSNIQIEWENEQNVSNRVVVSALDESGNRLRELARIEGKPVSAKSQVRLPRGEEVRWIRIDFSDFQGQNRLLLRLLTFFAWGSN